MQPKLGKSLVMMQFVQSFEYKVITTMYGLIILIADSESAPRDV